MDPLNAYSWVLTLKTSPNCPCSHPRQIHDSNYTPNHGHCQKWRPTRPEDCF